MSMTKDEIELLNLLDKMVRHKYGDDILNNLEIVDSMIDNEKSDLIYCLNPNTENVTKEFDEKYNKCVEKLMKKYKIDEDKINEIFPLQITCSMFLELYNYAIEKKSPKHVIDAILNLVKAPFSDLESNVIDSIVEEMNYPNTYIDKQLIDDILEIFDIFNDDNNLSSCFSFTTYGLVPLLKLSETSYELVERMIDKIKSPYFWGLILENENTHDAFKLLIKDKVKKTMTKAEYYGYK